MFWKVVILATIVVYSTVFSFVIPEGFDQLVVEQNAAGKGTLAPCNKGACKSGFVCGIGQYCYPITGQCGNGTSCSLGQTCADGSCYQGPEGTCVGGICPTGFTCGPQNLCFPQ